MKKAAWLVVFSLLFIIIISIIRAYIGDLRPAIESKKDFQLKTFASGLGAPRDLEFTPGGTLLASLTSQGRVVALPDKDNNGRTDKIVEIVSGLNNPHGLAFYKDKLFIVEEKRVVRYLWDENSLSAKQDKVLFSLPRGGRHVTRTIVFNKRGKMFVSLGSTCDVCFESHPWLGAVIVSDEAGKTPTLFAKGLRNSVFITINPQTDELWGTEMGRDFLGDEKPADEINIIKDGKDYGWPKCFEDRIHDISFDPSSRFKEECKTTEAPIYKIAAHSAPLGLVFDKQGDLLVSYHGSWNRSTPIGYKVVRLFVDGNKITGEEDLISGFLKGDTAIGRPVDLIFDKRGNLYISDDKAGLVYIIQPQEN